MTYELQFIMKGSGFFVNEAAGEALGEHKLVYRGADSLWYLADSDLAATMPTLGITMSPITATRRGRILRQGYIGDSTWTWTIGDEIYASATAGELTQVVPAGIIQIVGVAVSAVMIYFNSDLGSGVGATNVITVRKNTGANVGTRPRLNFIEGTSIAMTVVDDGVGNEVDITIDNSNHAARHEPAGADEVNDIDILNTGTLLSAHRARHEPAGADEINDIDIGNTGTLLSAHKSRHVVAGADTFVGGDLLDATARVLTRRNAGADVGPRRRLNFIEGANVTLTVVDDGANEEVDITIASAGAAATAWIKQFYPAPNLDSNYGTYASQIMPDGEDTLIRQTFLIPEDAATVDSALIIIISEASGNIRRSVDTNFAQNCVETYQTHVDTIAAGQVAVNINQITCLDFSAALTGATGYDMVGIEFSRLATNALDTIDADVHYLGILISGAL